ncbi:MAG TPA: hypothetical protein VHB21_22480 [Minicystis sp.]|nr:hypothetical protein [Minicystis sp.]
MRSSLVAGAVLAAGLFVARGASAGQDPYSPAAPTLPPPFYAGYGPAPQQSSFVPRSPGLRTLGLVLVVIGGVTIVAAPIVGSTSTSPAGDATVPASTDSVVLGLVLGGLGLIGAGVPIAVYGSTLVPPKPAPKAAVRLEPTVNGLRLVF